MSVIIYAAYMISMMFVLLAFVEILFDEEGKNNWRLYDSDPRRRCHINKLRKLSCLSRGLRMLSVLLFIITGAIIFLIALPVLLLVIGVVIAATFLIIPPMACLAAANVLDRAGGVDEYGVIDIKA